MGVSKPKFKINESYSSPENIDYDILGFHKKRTIILGELVKVEYYRHYDGVTYSDLILEETRAYTRDSNGLATHRNLNVKWYLKDGTIGVEKDTIKYYSPSEAIDEGMTRRGNIVGMAKLYVLSQVGLANGQDFLGSVNSEATLFVNGSTQPLRDAVTASTKPYMTPTIKGTTVFLLTY